MPGAAWNAGLDAIGPVGLAVCLEAGDEFAPSALDSMSHHFSRHTVALVTCGIEWIGPGTHRFVTRPKACSALDVLADTNAIHVSSMFRWEQWSSIRFNADMPALEHADLWLRILRNNASGVADCDALLCRRVHKRALYKRTWLSDEYRRAADLLFEQHRAVLTRTIGPVLRSHDAALRQEYERYQNTRMLSERISTDIDQLRSRTNTLLAAVDSSERKGADLSRRVSPLSHNWGYDRGTPADRPLIERFLAANRDAIRGDVLEIQEDDYTRRFGGRKVDSIQVLDIVADNPRATLLGDLRCLSHIEDACFDCIVITQTLHVIDDMAAVVRECRRLVKPGGTVLATLPCSSRVCLEYGPEADFWRVTEAGARRLFSDAFSSQEIETVSFGNAHLSAAFLRGAASQEVAPAAYSVNDVYFPMIVGVRATASDQKGTAIVKRRGPSLPGVVLLYHRIGDSRLDPFDLCVPDHLFRAQLEWLCNSCTVVSVSDVASRTTTRECSRTVALTFDDGYVDNLTTAAPLLKQFGVPAHFFVTAASAPDPRHYWWDQLTSAIWSSQSDCVEVKLPTGVQRLELSSDAARRASLHSIYAAVLPLPAADRNRLVAAVIDAFGWEPPADFPRCMTWAEIRSLGADSSFSIGAHTPEHLLLPEQSDDVLRRELELGKAIVGECTGREVDTLAYPFGAHDERTIAAARDAGYRLGFTCVQRPFGSWDDLLAVPRIEVTNAPLGTLTEKIELAFNRFRDAVD
jgi:peptidoglycan/xylan/chitin deacetylase (PgdA/CDA1 family)/SAM-dependent methyltransferase